MAFKFVFVFCCTALLVQCIAGQVIGPCDGMPRAGYLGPLNNGASWSAAPLAGIIASTGGGLVVSSVSPVAPVGLSVVSDNAIEGALSVGGALPYLGAVALEAAIPTAGTGAVTYGCGNGGVAVTAEDISGIGFAGIAGPSGYVPGITGPIAPGLAGPVGIAPGCGIDGIL